MVNSFKQLFTLHPFLFGLIPIIFMFSHNIHLIKPQDLISPISIVIISTIVLSIALSLILKNNKKAGLILSLGLAIFFLYGHLYNLADDFSDDVSLQHRYTIILSFIVFAIAILIIIKTKRTLENTTKIANVIGISIILISMVNIVMYSIESPKFSETDIAENTSIIKTIYGDVPPDVYYIILDAYAGPSALNDIFNYNNNEFYDYLTERGFYVPKNSKANYPWTYLSLSSTLNMNYLDKLGNETLQKRYDIAYQMIENNEVMKNFKNKGYKIINIQSDWGPTRDMALADLNLCTKYRGLVDSELFSMVASNSLLNPVYVKLFEEDRRSLILCHFSEMLEIPTLTNDPVFVFNHITIPHKPYIFGPNGEKVTPKSLELGQEVKDKEGYISQLQFTNKKTQELIESIFSQYDTPPVIIIQSDHGSDETEPSWSTLDELALKERYSIQNSYYLPDVHEELFYDTITPVNSFRIIFNHYFDDGYDLLQDKMFVPDPEPPHNFIDITAIVS